MTKPLRNSIAVTEDTPIRMEHAAQLAFPDGTITGRTLYGMAKAGRLEHSVFAGKHFTTLRFVRESMERCRVPASPQDFGLKNPPPIKKLVKSGKANGASSTPATNTVQAAAKLIAMALGAPSKTT